MHITLTGSHGFIGTHLRNHLEANGHTVDCWDLLINKDIANFDIDPKSDLCIHLAAKADIRESFKNPNLYWNENVVKCRKVFEQCDEHNIRVIYASSSACLEWHRNPYALSKYVDEFMAPKKSVGLRFSTVWGDGARDTMLISKIKLGIVKYATTHTRDFINVADVVNAIQTIIDNPDEKGVFECGCGIAFKVDQLVAKNGFDVPVTDGEDFELESNVLPSSKLRALGWEPKVNVMDTKLR
tara:strand:+ start:684 stop:1406 length:723 start_codon:yes stop_codon:yes gene_type:complete